jgi:uncharacterized cupin superfamily protein
MEKVNIFGVENPEGRIDVAGALGSKELAMFAYDVGPGEHTTYHYEYDEEWLLVVDGAVVLRTPDGEQPLERGDFVRFPAGPDGAHGVVNRSGTPARVLLFSIARGPAVSVYPDSDRICVWPGNDVDELVFKRATAVPWSPD